MQKSVAFQQQGPRRPDPYYADGANYVWMCGQMDLKSACRLIGVVEFLATILAFVLLIVFFNVFYSETYAYQLICGSGSLIVGIVCCIISVVILFLFFGGLKTENPALMLLHITAQILAMILMMFASIVSIVLIIGWSEVEFGPEVYLRPTKEGRIQDQYAADKTGTILGSIILSMCVIGIILDSWFLAIVYKTFRLFSKGSGGGATANGGRPMTTVY